MFHKQVVIVSFKYSLYPKGKDNIKGFIQLRKNWASVVYSLTFKVIRCFIF